MSSIPASQPPPDDVYERAIDIGKVAQTFRRHSVWVVLAASVGAGAGFLAAKLQAPVVVVSSRLHIQQLADAAVTPDTQALYSSFVEDPEIVGRVLKEMGLDQAPHQLTLQALEQAISPRSGTDGRSIFIDVRLADPEISKRVATSMARQAAEISSRRDLEANQAGVRAAMENLDAATEQYNRAAEAIEAFRIKEPAAFTLEPPPAALLELQENLGLAEKLRRRYESATDRAIKFSLRPRYAVRYVDDLVEVRVETVTARFVREGIALAVIVGGVVVYLRGLRSAL